MLVATCKRLFQISSEARTIEIDDSIVRRYASDAERDRESYTEVCDVCLSRPIILDVQACPILTVEPREGIAFLIIPTVRRPARPAARERWVGFPRRLSYPVGHAVS